MRRAMLAMLVGLGVALSGCTGVLDDAGDGTSTGSGSGGPGDGSGTSDNGEGSGQGTSGGDGRSGGANGGSGPGEADPATWRARSWEERFEAAQAHLEHAMGPDGSLALIQVAVEPADDNSSQDPGAPGDGSDPSHGDGSPDGAGDGNGTGAPDDSMGGGDAMMPMGLTMEAAFGSNGVTRMTASAGGFFEVTLWCSQDRSVLRFGDMDLEGRSRDDDNCGMTQRDGDAQEVLSHTVADDGTLDVTYRETDEDGEVSKLTMTIDTRDRVVGMAEHDEGSVMRGVFTYGERQPIPFPEPNGRSPLDLESETSFRSGNLTWTVVNHSEQAPLADFEVRVYGSDDEGNETLLATFDPADPGEQRVGNFTFTFVDDGDGLLGTGDTFTVHEPGWRFQFAYQVKVWDKWAEAHIGEFGLPLPAWLAWAALAACAVVLRGARRP